MARRARPYRTSAGYYVRSTTGRGDMAAYASKGQAVRHAKRLAAKGHSVCVYREHTHGDVRTLQCFRAKPRRKHGRR